MPCTFPYPFTFLFSTDAFQQISGNPDGTVSIDFWQYVNSLSSSLIMWTLPFCRFGSGLIVTCMNVYRIWGSKRSATRSTTDGVSSSFRRNLQFQQGGISPHRVISCNLQLLQKTKLCELWSIENNKHYLFIYLVIRWHVTYNLSWRKKNYLGNRIMH